MRKYDFYYYYYSGLSETWAGSKINKSTSDEV